MAIPGNTTYFAFGAPGTEQSLAGYANSADLKRTVKELEATTFGDTEEKYSPGLKSNEISIDGDWGSTLDGYLAPKLGVDLQSVIFGPAGNTAGMVKYTASAFLKDYEIKSEVTGKITFTGAVRIIGAPTRGVFP